jgi:phosphoribosylglycinamide formyltransferase-1
VPKGVINFHPGLLPEGRGLDAMQWAIYEDRPIGVTAHLIDGRVDAGLVLLKREIQIQQDDTVFDLSQRLMDIQTDMLPEALVMLDRGVAGLESVGRGNLHRKMPPELEAQISDRLRARQVRAKEAKA